MALFGDCESILLLEKLLRPPADNDNSSSDSEDDNLDKRSVSGPSQIGPSDFGPKPHSSSATKITAPKPEQSAPKPEPEQKKETCIEEWLEEQEKKDKDELETRKRPEYKITYKQSVGTEDLYLQMGNKTCASSSCEDMVIEVLMPEETVAVHEMDISVTETEIDLGTPVYRLKLPLAHPINPDKSSAKYFTEKKTLCLTCRMNREWDYVNF